ncbi:MAG: methyltransferase domain-containing protein, partial [Candidatus Poribacteria bacterium]|nr:methyltransferase domain-containing protein [Candidatus Poribacteria bacterium]
HRTARVPHAEQGCLNRNPNGNDFVHFLEGNPMGISIKDALLYVCCPDCSGDLISVDSKSTTGLLCKACQLVFPTSQGIPIILDATSRNAAFEAPLVQKLLDLESNASVRQACEKTLKLLDRQSELSYAWEDERHWTPEYERLLKSGSEKNWNDRYWQREPLFQVAIDSLRTAGTAHARTVIDLGCGEGQDFRLFLAPEFEPNDLYVGLDISLASLVLNRTRNPHQRSLFILGSADRPPLRSRIADIIICLGTLHHTQAKEMGLSVIARLLRRGIIVISDPINGSFLPPSLRLSRASRSTHDDFIDYRELKRLIQTQGFSVPYERQFSGLAYALLMRLFRPVLIRNRTLHRLAHRIDDFLSKRLGPRFDIFKPRGLLIALRSG